MTDPTRFTYLINQCLKFLWTRDQQEEIQKLGNAIVKENERLRAHIDQLETVARIGRLYVEHEALKGGTAMYDLAVIDTALKAGTP
jgi:hypothetical protein